MYRNRFGYICFIALLALCLLLPAALADEPALYGCVTGGELRLREEPKTDATVVEGYPTGTWVQILDTSDDGQWLHVYTFDDKEGYMEAEFLIQDVAGNTNNGVVANEGKFVNLHEAPSLDAQVLAQVPDATPLTILSHESGWYEVRVDDALGYMVDEMVRSGSKPVAYKYVSTENGGNVNLRSGPTEEADVLRGVGIHTEVDVLIKGKSWDKVRVKGQLGFMATRFLSDRGGDDERIPVSYSIGYVATNQAGSTLRLREGPNTASRVLGSYHNGTKVKILSRGSHWDEVSINGLRGYMQSAFISAKKKTYDEPTDDLPHYNADGYIAATVVNPNSGDAVNLRSGPSLEADVTGSVPVGDQVEIFSKGRDWCKVRAGGEWGYISIHFLQLH